MVQRDQSDVVFARKGAVMAVTSPRVTSIAIGQEITAEELGGWKLHTEVTGLVDQAFDTDEEVLDAVRTFLSLTCRATKGEAPPRVAEAETGGRCAGKAAGDRAGGAAARLRLRAACCAPSPTRAACSS